MKQLIVGILIGSCLTGVLAFAQNPDFYGRPQWGKKVYPPYDAYGRPNPPPVEDHLLPKRHNPC